MHCSEWKHCPLVQVTSGSKPNTPTYVLVYKLIHGFETTLTIHMLWDIFDKPVHVNHNQWQVCLAWTGEGTHCAWKCLWNVAAHNLASLLHVL